MAKDDYYVIVYKVLIYLYAVLKKKKTFTETEFKGTILKGGIDEGYLISVLEMMQEDELIKGLSFSNVWGSEIILINDYHNMKITSKGIDYLIENAKMKQVKKFLLESKDIFASLIMIVLPI